MPNMYSFFFTNCRTDFTLVGWFLIAPLSVTLVGILLFTASIFYSWLQVTRTSNQVLSESAASRIKSTLVKIVATFVGPACLLIASTIIHHVYLFKESPQWDSSLLRHLVCLAKGSDTSSCKFNRRPSLLRIQLQILCLFASSILVSSLVWTKATCRTWKRFFLQLLLRYCSLTSSSGNNRQGEEISGKGGHHDIRVRKHELIAQAYSKRNQLKEDGR